VKIHPAFSQPPSGPPLSFFPFPMIGLTCGVFVVFSVLNHTSSFPADRVTPPVRQSFFFSCKRRRCPPPDVKIFFLLTTDDFFPPPPCPNESFFWSVKGNWVYFSLSWFSPPTPSVLGSCHPPPTSFFFFFPFLSFGRES